MASRISFKVEGVVQGVNYRSFTARQGSHLGLTGFVQNDPDGTVSGEAQGEKSSLKDFLQQLNQGPSHAKVTKVDQSDIAVKRGECAFTSY